MDIWLYLFVLVVMLVLGAVFFGAPYVPTRSRDVRALLKHLSSNDVLVDLGCGDGRLVKAAAMRGNKAYGIELSPVLAAISWVRTRRFGKRAVISLGNYWQMPLPDDTTVVFVFLASSYMKKLQAYLEKEAKRLGRPIKLVSYGFELPGYEPVAADGALIVYKIKP